MTARRPGAGRNSERGARLPGAPLVWVQFTPGLRPGPGGYSATVQLSDAASLLTSLPSASSYTALTLMLASAPTW